MKVTADHWLEDVDRDLIPGGSTMPVRRFLVIHFTAGASGRSSIEWWKNPAAKGTSAHIVVERDGTIIQCRPFNKTCGHAGKSKWKDPKTGVLYTGLNSCSIGIEIANGGNSYPRKFSTLPPTKAAHKNGGPVVEWETYPAAQLAAMEKISQTLVKRYILDDVVGHDDISPDRKQDPGPAFPMKALRAACGFTKPLPHEH